MASSVAANGLLSRVPASASIPAPQVSALASASASTSLTVSKPSSRAMHTSLQDLPSELLYPIAEYLVPSPPLTTRFALRPTGTWEFRDADHQWADWLVGHTNLLNFAQTSQRMASVAKPLLYHTIVIRDEKSLITLFQRMKLRPEICSWIRNISCLVNITGVVTVTRLLQEWEWRTGVRWSGPTLDIDIGVELFRSIVRGASSLRDLHIAFPDHEHPDPEPDPFTPTDLFLTIYRHTVLEYLTDPESHSLSDLPVSRCFPPDILRNLTSLRIYCHREDGDRDVTFSRMLTDYAVACLPDMKNLKTLEVCCSSANNVFLDDVTLPPLPHIKNLRLYGSHIHEPRLVAFCLACVNLESLLVHFEASSTDEDRDRLPEGKTLNEALIGLAGSLRTLELVALSEGHYLTRGSERPRKPENHRLTCIPELTRLESLTLDYRGVFGTLGILEEDDGERLCQLLPASLKHFIMVCEWGTAKDWKQSYLANLDMILYGVKCLCLTSSPRLSSISLAIHSWPAKSRFHRRFEREVEEARQICARVGIMFKTFDLLPCYQDEDEVEPVEEEDFEDDDGEDDAEYEAVEEEDELELEEEDEASEYYFSGDEESDPERDARRPATFDDFLQALGEDHGHNMDDLFYAYHEDRWDEYLF